MMDKAEERGWEKNRCLVCGKVEKRVGITDEQGQVKIVDVHVGVYEMERKS